MEKLKDAFYSFLITIGVIILIIIFLKMGEKDEGVAKIIFITIISLVSINIAIAVPDNNFLKVTGKRFIWLMGVSSGSMLMSSSIFILPTAMNQNIKFGSIGIGIGFLIGYVVHTISHNSSHFLNDYLNGREEIVNLTIHTIFTATILGIIYSQTPSISIILGVAVISHKLPASLSTTRRLIENNKSVYYILIPSLSFAFAISLSFYFKPEMSLVTSSFIFGIGTGIFIHLAMDLLPECSQGQMEELVSQTEEEHQKLDNLRYHSMISVISGASIVLLFWILLV